MVSECAVDQSRTGTGGSPESIKEHHHKDKAGRGANGAASIKNPHLTAVTRMIEQYRPEFPVVQRARVNWLWINSACLAPAGYQNTSLHY